MDTLHTVLAAVPIALVAIALACRMKPIPVVLGAIAVTLALSFAFPLTADAALASARDLAPLTLSVSLIIFGGVLISETLAASGAQARIGAWIEGVTHTRERAALLVGFTVAPLAEALIGWGVGVIVAVPLLIRLGYSAVTSATISLLGLVLCAWGSLGPGMLVSSRLSGVPFDEVGLWSALLNLPVFVVMGLAMTYFIGGARGILRQAGDVLSTAVVMWLVLVAVNLWVSVPLGGVISSLAGLGWLVLIARISGGRGVAMDAATARSLAPYGVLVGSLLVATAVHPLIPSDAVAEIVTSPATWLVITAALTPWLLGLDRATARDGRARGMRLFWPVWIISVLFILLGALFAMNGMAAALASGASALGAGFLLIVPLMGFIGGYTTASNTAISAMFSAGIAQVSLALDASPAVAIGAQNVTGAAAVMASPARIAVAVTIANESRPEGSPAVDLRIPVVATLMTNLVVVAILAPITMMLATAVGV